MNYYQKHIIIFSLFGFFFLSNFSCANHQYRNSKLPTEVNDTINVKLFGVYGDGVTDDREAIQNSMQKNKIIYFPPGKYLLKTKTTSQSFIFINEKNAPKEIVFAKNAQIILSKDIPKDYKKPAIFYVISEKDDINTIKFSGINLDGNRFENNLACPGILAYSRKNTIIDSLLIHDVYIKNCGGSGIHSRAVNNFFSDITTISSGSHGIGLTQSNNQDRVHYLNLVNHHSFNDQGYSIDFSGPKNKKVPLKGYAWKGYAKNIYSENSTYGIKTAGNWTLDIDNLTIKNSKYNGFFINVDAPNDTLRLSNVYIENVKRNGMALSGNTVFYGKNIHIKNCGGGIGISKTRVYIDSLTLESIYDKYALYSGSESVEINNFLIKNTNQRSVYPIILSGKKNILRNGTLKNISSKYPIIFHKNSKNVTLENINIIDGFGKEIPSVNIMNMQEIESYQINDLTKQKSRYKIFNKSSK